MSRTLFTVALACGALALAGCGQPSNPGEADGATATAETSTTTTSTDPATTTPAAPAATDAGASTTTASTANLPAQCTSYLNRVQQCVDRLGANSPASGMMRQQLDSTRQQWSQITDQAALSQACTVADQQWTQTSSAMGC